MSEKFNLDRQVNIENNIDATGKKWEIVHLKGSALYEARVNPYNAQTNIPKEFEGRWTKPILLEKQIKKYLNASWDAAEEAQKHAAANARSAEKRKATKEANASAEE